jgi:N-acetyl-anhydromuramyl-L-alanine amidase AmpD
MTHPSTRGRFLARLASVAVAVAALASPASAAAPTAVADCPSSLGCDFVPAAYQQNGANPINYGNYSIAQRDGDGLDIRYVVVHDTEVDYATTLALFQNSRVYASSHYVVRSSDGHVTQMVENKNVAWHAGNWYVNTHAIGIEHEGLATDPSRYTQSMYESSATLVRHLAAEYGIPLDRAHLIGHDEVPGPTADRIPTMHWDPGPFWDWARYMSLVGKPIAPDTTTGNVVTIAPNFATNTPPVRDCAAGRDLPSQPANFVYLHTAPDDGAPLFDDPGFDTASRSGGTLCANDWGDKAMTGEQFYRVAHRGDGWDAIYYAGNILWFKNPAAAPTAFAGAGAVITPKAGKKSIPVYGKANPEGVYTPTATAYSIPQGQSYVAYEKVEGDYYYTSVYGDLAHTQVVKTGTQYYLIRFNHRMAYVLASDVDVMTR